MATPATLPKAPSTLFGARLSSERMFLPLLAMPSVPLWTTAVACTLLGIACTPLPIQGPHPSFAPRIVSNFFRPSDQNALFLRMGQYEPSQIRAVEQSSFEDPENSHEMLSHEKGGNTRDEVDMSRMGKKQELRVRRSDNFHFTCFNVL
jgi:hypothetical protein